MLYLYVTATLVPSLVEPQKLSLGPSRPLETPVVSPEFRKVFTQNNHKAGGVDIQHTQTAPVSSVPIQHHSLQ
jgi:hypothetical protein